MIVVDACVWIDYLANRQTLQTLRLDQLLASKRLMIADLVLAEVLRGIANEREFNLTYAKLRTFAPLTVSSHEIALLAAQYHRMLRARGFTVRGTIDALIATRCIRDDLSLLTSDRDFTPFFEHLGLRDAMAEA